MTVDIAELEPWKHDFILGLRAGKSLVDLAKSCAGMPVSWVQQQRQEDEAFGAAWDEVDKNIAENPITPQLLEKAMNAQVPDDRAAAFFGLTVEQFKAKVDADPALKKIYELGRPAGLAKAEMKIFDEVKQGNWQATQHFAKHRLGQGDGNAAAPPAVSVTFNIADPAASYRALLAGGTLALPDIVVDKVTDAAGPIE